VRRIAVLGGGVAGLAAANRIQELAREHGTAVEVTLYEREAHAGGCIQTVRDGGFTMELGPDSLLIDKPAAARLIERLNLNGEIVDMLPHFKGARIVHRGKLHRIPPDFRLFTPTSIPALLTSGIFSPAGLARAAMEPFVPKRADGGDESLASFVTRRLGREVLDRLAQPLIGGIYSGDPQRLSMRATLPHFLEMEQRYGSLMRGLQRAGAARGGVRLVSLRGGLGSLVDALRSRIGDVVRTGASVDALSLSGGVCSIRFDNGETAQADAIVCALPAYVAASLVRPHDAQLAQLLNSIRYNSIATVNLTYDAAAGSALPRSSGFVVPFVERRSIAAATFTTQKYPDRSPRGALLVRAFIGGALQPDLVDAPDGELVRMAHDDLAALAGVTQPPRGSLVTRWLRLLPEYGVGHTDLVAKIEQRAPNLPGFAIAGSAYRGVGIPDCIATGEAAAGSAFGYVAP
jgi:oxygen-dependent protoporphyrinogen oxidase